MANLESLLFATSIIGSLAIFSPILLFDSLRVSNSRSPFGQMLIPNSEARLLVSLLPSEEVLPTNDPPADQIRCVQTVEQTSTPIRFRVHDLLSRPRREELWERCFVETDEFESVRSPWYEIKHLPGIHFVGETTDDEFVEVAVAESYIWRLLDEDVDFSRVPQRDLGYDVSQPKQRDVEAYGYSKASGKADTRFLRNALRGIYSSSGRGLDQYYRHYTRRPDLLVKIEWGILLRDIRTSSPQVLKELAQSRFVALQLLKDPNGVLACQNIDAEEGSWIRRLEDLARQNTSAMEAHLTEEERRAELEASICDLWLLRRLFELSNGRSSATEHKFYQGLEDENLAKLGYLGVIGAAISRLFDAWNMDNALSNARSPEGHEHGLRFQTQVFVAARKPRARIRVSWVGVAALTALLATALMMLLCGKAPALLVHPIIDLLAAGGCMLWNPRRRERVDESRQHYDGVVGLDKVVIDCTGDS